MRKGTIQEQAVTLHQASLLCVVTNPILVGIPGVALSPWAYAVLTRARQPRWCCWPPAAYANHRHDSPFGFLLRVPLLNDVCLPCSTQYGPQAAQEWAQEAFLADPVRMRYLKAVALFGWTENISSLLSSTKRCGLELAATESGVFKDSCTGDHCNRRIRYAVEAVQNSLDLHHAIASSEWWSFPCGTRYRPCIPKPVLQAVDMAGFDSHAPANR